MNPAPAVRALDAPGASIDQVGGKALGLAVLVASGLPVPPGFVVTTDAYLAFVRANGADAFETAPMSALLQTEIAAAYTALGGGPVAVRSSATAEDLPDLSFAGVQDTFLNVHGEAALMDAVRGCWASLHSERAIAYRAKMNVDSSAVAMAVVVQSMVNADASGVLFTANPATGDRDEVVINAGFGLGEGVVGGHVTPDTVVLNRADLAVKSTIIGPKLKMVVCAPEQGTELVAVPDAMRGNAALPADSLREIATLGLQAEKLLGGQPQDVEWAVAGDRCWLLQSRPITRLPTPAPTVSWEPPEPGSKLMRRQVVENMPEPLSPLFETLYLEEGLDLGMDYLARGMKLPLEFGDFITRPIFVTVNGYGYCRWDFRLSWRTLFSTVPKVFYWYATSLPKLLRELVLGWREELAQYLATIDLWKSADASHATDAELLSGIRELAFADARYWYHITMVVGAAKITEWLLDKLVSSRLVPGKLTAVLFLRGFPSRTLEAQRGLALIARDIAEDPELRDLTFASPPDRVMQRLAAHLATYGHQVYNLDFVAPTQEEDPIPVLLSLQALIADPEARESWESRTSAMARQRESLERSTRASLGPLRRRMFDKLLAAAQKYGSCREEALFHMGAAWPTLRRLALELGQRLTSTGVLAEPDDVFYLTPAELAKLTGDGPNASFAALARQRRDLREARKRLHPPGRVPPELRFKLGPLDFTRFIEVWETQKKKRR